VIGRVLKRGQRVYGLLWYLYSPGKECVHSNPHLVAGWRHPAGLEPPLRDNGKRDFRRLTGLLEQPLALLDDQAPAKPVWHCTVRAAPGDPDLGDGAWMRIAAEIMHRTGLSRCGEEHLGVRWVAVHHGENHIHIAATLARQDGRRARPDNDWYRIGEALRDLEAEYGLQVVARADRTAAKRPARAEREKAARAGRPEPPRVTLQRQAAAAAAGARSQPEFFAALKRRNVLVRLRYSTHNPGQVTGYAVGLDGDAAAGGDQIWYGGGKLAPDLSLPKLRRRWPEPGQRAHRPHDAPEAARPRLDGHRMTAKPARATLRREVNMCATAARSEPDFFTGLDAAGLLVRLHHSPASPAQVTGYAVSLPGMTHRDGQQTWYGGHTLDGQLGLGALRRRWQAGHSGAPPSPQAFAAADTRAVFDYATAVASDAARQIRLSPAAAQAADIAWATADILAAAAQATGSPELQQAADGFGRAARAPWGRIPPPSPGGASLRTAAYLLAACTPPGTRRRIDRLALISALAGLAGAVGALREAQNRLLQATAAHRAATRLAAAGAAPGPPGAPALFSAEELFGAPVTGWPGPARAGRPGPGRRSPGRPARPPGPGPAR
jgi:relaxase-like protein